LNTLQQYSNIRLVRLRLNEFHLFMSPVISDPVWWRDPDTTFLQVISSTAVAKCTLSFQNLKSSRMVEVKQLC